MGVAVELKNTAPPRLHVVFAAPRCGVSADLLVGAAARRRSRLAWDAGALPSPRVHRQESSSARAGGDRRRPASDLAARSRTRRSLRHLSSRHRRSGVRWRAAAVRCASRAPGCRRTRPIASAAQRATTARARRPTSSTRRTSRSRSCRGRCGRSRRSKPTAAFATARSIRSMRRASPKVAIDRALRLLQLPRDSRLRGPNVPRPGARQHRIQSPARMAGGVAGRSEKLPAAIEDGQLPIVRRRDREPAGLSALAAGAVAARQHRDRLEESRHGQRAGAVRRAPLRQLPRGERTRRDDGTRAHADWGQGATRLAVQLSEGSTPRPAGHADAAVPADRRSAAGPHRLPFRRVQFGRRRGRAAAGGVSGCPARSRRTRGLRAPWLSELPSARGHQRIRDESGRVWRASRTAIPTSCRTAARSYGTPPTTTSS